MKAGRELSLLPCVEARAVNAPLDAVLILDVGVLAVVGPRVVDPPQPD